MKPVWSCHTIRRYGIPLEQIWLPPGGVERGYVCLGIYASVALYSEGKLAGVLVSIAGPRKCKLQHCNSQTGSITNGDSIPENIGKI